MTTLRPATIDDLFSIQFCNVMNLPENYKMYYYYYHLLSWPQLTQVAEDHNGKIVGYVLAKIDNDLKLTHGHITSVSVMRDYRMLGLGFKLMKLTHRAMEETHNVPCVSLHVRVTNKAAYKLYSQSLGYTIGNLESSYYADKEDAFHMWHFFKEGHNKPESGCLKEGLENKPISELLDHQKNLNNSMETDTEPANIVIDNSEMPESPGTSNHEPTKAKKSKKKKKKVGG